MPTPHDVVRVRTTTRSSAVVCCRQDCGAPFPLEQVIAWSGMALRHMTCEAGHSVTSSVDVSWDEETVNAGNEKYLNNRTVHTETFWHATKVPNWLSTVQKVASTADRNGSQFVVHVGNRRTAEVIIPQAEGGAGVSQTPKGLRINNYWMMWELRLIPGIRVARDIIDDDNLACDQFRIIKPTRYVNRYEIPGDISIVVDPRHLIAVSRRRVQFPRSALSA